MTQPFDITGLHIPIIEGPSRSELSTAYAHAYSPNFPHFVELTATDGTRYTVRVTALKYESEDMDRHLFLGHLVRSRRGRVRDTTMHGQHVLGFMNTHRLDGYLRISREPLSF